MWFSFEATADQHSITIDGSEGFDATVDLRAGTCGATTSIACQDGASAGGVETLNAIGLTVGETYYVRAVVGIGKWVGHPDLIPSTREEFEAAAPGLTWTKVLQAWR